MRGEVRTAKCSFRLVLIHWPTPFLLVRSRCESYLIQRGHQLIFPPSEMSPIFIGVLAISSSSHLDRTGSLKPPHPLLRS